MPHDGEAGLMPKTVSIKKIKYPYEKWLAQIVYDNTNVSFSLSDFLPPIYDRSSVTLEQTRPSEKRKHKKFKIKNSCGPVENWGNIVTCLL